MSDEIHPPTDERDDELTAMLAVPALDETTRQRLVRTALDEADASTEGAADADDELAGRRVGRISAALGVAAALVIGTVVGTVIVTRPDDPTTPTAARAPETSTDAGEKAVAPDPAGATDSDPAEAPAAAAAPAVDLGDLGAVDGANGVRSAVNRRLEAGTSSTPVASLGWCS